MHVSAIIAAGGRGARFGGERPKQVLPLAGRPILQHSVDAFRRAPAVDDIVVALPAALVASPPPYLVGGDTPIALVTGGTQRRDSIANAFEAVARRVDIVVIHDAARPLVSQALIERTITAAAVDGAASAALAATDTVKRAGRDGCVRETLPRDEIYLAQTPQAFRVAVLREALAQHESAEASDEARLVELAGHAVRLVEGEARNLKITTPEDLTMAERLLRTGEGSVGGLRIGNGYDLHRLVAGRPLVLGGVTIPFEQGLDGHSDADAVCHAVTDALLGAAGAGDIGRHFQNSDPAWEGADSVSLLARATDLVREAGYAVVSVDVVVVAERPKLAPYLDRMRARLAKAIGVDAGRIGLKGKTNEGMDATGAGMAIAVYAVALLMASKAVQ